MPPRRSTPNGTEDVAAQANSGDKSGPKKVAGGQVSASRRRSSGAKRWKPGAGALLRADMWRDTDTGGIKLLVEQACRVADRLEQLARANGGDVDAILSLDLGRILAQETPSGDRKAFYVEVSMKVDASVAEERQQAKLFASLLADIARQRSALPPAPPESGQRGDGKRAKGDLDF